MWMPVHVHMYVCVCVLVPLVPGSVGVFKLILCLSAPIAFIKNCISVLQLCVAAQSMARIDVEERSGVNSKTE